MVQNQMSFAQAVKDLKLPLEGYECDVLQKRADFKKVLRQEKYAFASDVANTPGRNKSTVVGMMMVAADNLLSEGEWEKAASVLEKIAKLEGMVNGDNVTIFAGLTARDIEDARVRLQEQIDRKTETRPN